jgi:hypothetical protein
VPHRTFPGNRPSISLLFPQLTAFTTGQMLSLYEHRTAVQGFIWDINSWDQWGVELGKGLATDIRSRILDARSAASAASTNPAAAAAAAASASAAKDNTVDSGNSGDNGSSDRSSDAASSSVISSSDSGSSSATATSSAAGVLPVSVLATLNPSTQMLLTRYDSIHLEQYYEAAIRSRVRIIALGNLPALTLHIVCFV